MSRKPQNKLREAIPTPPPAPLPEPETIDFGGIFNEYASGAIDLIVVLGPTASGKTRYAVDLARELSQAASEAGAEIISADSRQVYRGMDIATGKDLSEYGDIPYHLIDIAEAGSDYNVVEFQKDFIKVYADIRRRGATPILCGGTGMYINAVTAGYDFNSRAPLSAPKSPRRSEGLPVKPYFIGTLVSRQ